MRPATWCRFIAAFVTAVTVMFASVNAVAQRPSSTQMWEARQLSPAFFGALEQAAKIPHRRFSPIYNEGGVWESHSVTKADTLKIVGVEVAGFGTPVLVYVEYASNEHQHFFKQGGRAGIPTGTLFFGRPAYAEFMHAFPLQRDPVRSSPAATVYRGSGRNYRFELTESSTGNGARLRVGIPLLPAPAGTFRVDVPALKRLIASRANPTIGAATGNPQSYVFAPATFHGTVDRVLPGDLFAVMIVPDPVDQTLCHRIMVKSLSPDIMRMLQKNEVATVSGIITNAQFGFASLGTLVAMPTLRAASVERADDIPAKSCSESPNEN